MEVGRERKWEPKFGRLPAVAAETAEKCWLMLAAGRKWGLWPSHFPSQGSQRGISVGKVQNAGSEVLKGTTDW